MTSSNRIATIKQRLLTAFSPAQLEVQDDSAQHAGHAGSQGGAGHYTVIIAADCFKDKTRIAVHREIYDVLADMIPEQIHALRIRL